MRLVRGIKSTGAARQGPWKKRSFGVRQTKMLHVPSQPDLSFLTWKMGIHYPKGVNGVTYLDSHRCSSAPQPQAVQEAVGWEHTWKSLKKYFKGPMCKSKNLNSFAKEHFKGPDMQK